MNSTPLSPATKLVYYAAIGLALWFALAGMVWAYYTALFVAYPFGLLSLFFWWRIRDRLGKRRKVIPVILLVGLALSLGVLIALLITN
ncbi:MAG: hypothetical protein EOO15_17345 [Chitinophagaceae bacterium]|nr:MAG: hypothetical protein EOO15_17345 [Chitinophagaceae bacterium]